MRARAAALGAAFSSVGTAGRPGAGGEGGA